MKKLYVETPLIESRPMSQAFGKDVFLKMECDQPIGSFKIRGIGYLCQELISAGKKHLVASSGGNAGLAVAYAARKLGVDATVFVPTSTHQLFIDCIEAEGATVNIKGDVWDETNAIAQQFVKKINGGFVPPFDHPQIWVGHSTLIDEAVIQMEKPDAIVVAVGGGGLSCGILEGLYRHGWNNVPLFLVETEGAASFAASVKAKKVVTLPKINTIATSLGAKRITQQLFDWTQKHSITSLTVSDKESVLACRRFADDHRVLVEPACGVALAVVYGKAPELIGLNSLLVIVCGGVGMSIDLLNEYMKRFSH